MYSIDSYIDLGYWYKLGSAGCVGTRNNHGIIKEITYSGAFQFVGAMKLVHKNGYIGCYATARSNLGCDPGTSGLLMVITDSKTQIMYPSSRLVKINRYRVGTN